MPFGSQNVPGLLQPTMYVILSSVKWQFVLFYQENIIIFSKTSEQHIDLVPEVLLLLCNAGAILS